MRLVFLCGAAALSLANTVCLAHSSGDEEALLFADIPSVYTASRHDQPVTKAPSSVDIVTADQIKKYGYRTLAEALRSLPGFFSTYDRAYNHIGVRGFAPPGDYNMRLLVLVDGHRINDNLQDYSAIGREFIVDMGSIDRVEVVRGPASALYGSNAFFGVVNVITKRGRDLQGGQVAGEVGSFDAYEGQLRYGKKYESGVEAYFAVTHTQIGGHDTLYFPELDAPKTHYGVARNLDADHAERGFGKLSYGDFTLSGGYVTRKKQLPNGPNTTIFNDPRLYYRDERAYADLNYHHVFEGGADITGRLFWDHYAFDDALPYLSDSNQRILNKDLWLGEWFGGELLGSRTFFDVHRLTLGGEFRRNYWQEMRNVDVAPYQTVADNRLSSSVHGIFLQDEWSILDNLTLSMGARYDHYDQSGSMFTPRLGLIYEPVRGTVVKLLYGEAFRAPNAFESQYTCCAGKWIGNRHLRPETIKTYELVLQQSLGEYFRLRLSPFYNVMHDVTTLTQTAGPDGQADTGDDLHIYRNTGNLEAAGVETTLEGLWRAWEGRLSYSFQDSKFRDTGMALVNSPVHMVKFNLMAPLWSEKTYAGLEVQYMSPRLTENGGQVRSHVLTNLTLFSSRWLSGLEVSGSVYNLFDERYRDPAGYPLSVNSVLQDGRSLRLKLSYDF